MTMMMMVIIVISITFSSGSRQNGPAQLNSAKGDDF